MAENDPNPAAQGGGVADYTLTTSNLDEVEDECNKVLVSHKLVPLTRDTRAITEIRLLGTRDFGVLNTRYGQSLMASTEPQADDRIVLLTAAEGAGQVDLGRNQFVFTEQQGVVFSSGPDISLRYLDDTESQFLLLNRRKLVDQCARLLGREIDRPLEFDKSFSLESAAGSNWQRLVDYASRELGHPHSLIRHVPAAQQNFEQMLMTALLIGHSHSYSEALRQPQSSAAPYYVRRAEAYIEAHFDGPLSLADIAAHAGVSARSLQNGFQSFRHMTPMAFLRKVRLEHAHRALLAADPAGATVTEIALGCGFAHMGEFGALYKRTFGVTPKQTLMKALIR